MGIYRGYVDDIGDNGKENGAVFRVSGLNPKSKGLVAKGAGA